MRNIILTGYMGTGKTSAGKLLASKLGYRLLDLDSMIVEQERTSINDIFAARGEAYFRQVESELLSRALEGERIVVSTGGGAVISEHNRRLMRKAGVVVNLTATPAAVLKRLEGDDARPLLRDEKGMDKVRTMLAEREPFYADADIRIDTTGKNVEDVVREIMTIIERGV